MTDGMKTSELLQIYDASRLHWVKDLRLKPGQPPVYFAVMRGEDKFMGGTWRFDEAVEIARDLNAREAFMAALDILEKRAFGRAPIIATIRALRSEMMTPPRSAPSPP